MQNYETHYAAIFPALFYEKYSEFQLAFLDFIALNMWPLYGKKTVAYVSRSKVFWGSWKAFLIINPHKSHLLRAQKNEYTLKVRFLPQQAVAHFNLTVREFTLEKNPENKWNCKYIATETLFICACG